jgi:hypothetical protein
LALLGLPLFAYLLLRSNLHYRRGEITWKGRGYDPRREPRGGQDARTGGAEEDQPEKRILKTAGKAVRNLEVRH